MKEIKLLDCTLRDGGYVNEWNFGYGVIKEMIQKLVLSNIDIIECGYLSCTRHVSCNHSIFASFEDLRKVVAMKKPGQTYAVMINFGEVPIDCIQKEEEHYILRVAFHKKDKTEAIAYCKQLIEKGYEVFVQPMGTLDYSDFELLELIEQCNQIEPSAFYIVDSFGVIETKDFKRLLYLADNNLKSSIQLGYHSHNNLQQAYGNAKFMVEQHLEHRIILDGSVFGMGRGAGNLNMELFAEYLNKNCGKSYLVEPLLEIIDNNLKPIFNQNFWGYSLPFYLSSIYNCHPNYASYFSDKNTLSIKSMNEILKSIPSRQKGEFTKEAAEEIYLSYQKNYVDDREVIQTLKEELGNRNILIMAPGKTIKIYQESIQNYIKEYNPIVISVNIQNSFYESDYLICSNEKRFEKIKDCKNEKLILTSNLKVEGENVYTINYSSYLCKELTIADNPTLILINLLCTLGIHQVAIAGFDGYQLNPKENYFEHDLSLGTSSHTKVVKNQLIAKELETLKEQIHVRFLTPSMYENLGAKKE